MSVCFKLAFLKSIFYSYKLNFCRPFRNYKITTLTPEDSPAVSEEHDDSYDVSDVPTFVLIAKGTILISF